MSPSGTLVVTAPQHRPWRRPQPTVLDSWTDQNSRRDQNRSNAGAVARPEPGTNCRCSITAWREATSCFIELMLGHLLPTRSCNGLSGFGSCSSLIGEQHEYLAQSRRCDGGTLKCQAKDYFGVIMAQGCTFLPHLFAVAVVLYWLAAWLLACRQQCRMSVTCSISAGIKRCQRCRAC